MYTQIMLRPGARWLGVKGGAVVGALVGAACVGGWVCGCAGSDASEQGGAIGRGIPPVESSIEGAPSVQSGTVEIDEDESWVGSATEGERVVVHPLTRVGADADGRSALLLHLEVRDRFGQSIKALGEVRVELISSGQGAGRAWVVDLRDAGVNAELFDDLVTRTYVLPLGGVPEWLSAWAKGEEGGAESARVRVRFRVAEGGKELRASERVKR